MVEQEMNEIMIHVEKHLYNQLLNNVHQILLLLQSKILILIIKKKFFWFFSSGGSTTISSYSDIEKFRSRCGPAHGVMLCQAAMWNPSIFRSDGLLSISDVAKRFLELVNFNSYHFFLKNNKIFILESWIW